MKSPKQNNEPIEVELDFHWDPQAVSTLKTVAGTDMVYNLDEYFKYIQNFYSTGQSPDKHTEIYPEKFDL